MIRETVHALIVCLATFVLCAVAYPAAVWGLGWLAFPRQAEGSLIRRDGKVIGSELIAQPFASDKYFFPRPSAVDYKADATGGSNLGTKNPDQRKKVAERAEALHATRSNPAPVDLVMASGGGLDPDISPAAAYYQAARVAAARGLPVDRIRALIDRRIERSGAILGAPPRVNVLLLNLDLDRENPTTTSSATAEPGAPEPVATAQPSGPTEPSSPAPEAEPKAARPAPSGEVEALSKRLDRLQERVEAAHREGLAAEFQDLKAQVAKLTEASGGVGRSHEKLSELDKRIVAMDQEVRALRSDVRALRDDPKSGETKEAWDKQLQTLRSEVGSLRETVKKVETPDRGSEKSESGPDLGPAIKLFQDKQYPAASYSFGILSRTDPDDARVWYYAALARGLTTNQWRGETEELVTKGIERERAGTPATAEIDAAFNGLPRDAGGEWLAHYRQRATRR